MHRISFYFYSIIRFQFRSFMIPIPNEKINVRLSVCSRSGGQSAHAQVATSELCARQDLGALGRGQRYNI